MSTGFRRFSLLGLLVAVVALVSLSVVLGVARAAAPLTATGTLRVGGYQCGVNYSDTATAIGTVKLTQRAGTTSISVAVTLRGAEPNAQYAVQLQTGSTAYCFTEANDTINTNSKGAGRTTFSLSSGAGYFYVYVAHGVTQFAITDGMTPS